MGTYYPSFVVNMELRFDEAFNVVEDDSPPGLSPTVVVDGRPEAFGPPLVRPLILQGQRDQLTQAAGCTPRSGSVELNGLRQAHTFNLTFDFRDLPIDMRLLRDARIEIFLGMVKPENFARGMTRVDRNDKGQPYRASTADTQLSSTNDTKLLLVGMIDEGTTEHTEKGSFVHISGRDLRGVLLDTKVDPRTYKSLDLTKPINDVVAQIISKSPFGKYVNVYAQEQEWPDSQIPSPGTADGSTRLLQGADGKQGATYNPMGPGDMIGFWDIIVKYCALVGAVPYFEGKDLRIRPLRSLFQQVQWDPDHPTPFTAGAPRLLQLDGKTEKINIRRFVYGRDLLNVKFSRKYRGQKSPAIECVSIDTGSKKRGLGKLVIGRYPNNTKVDPKTGKVIERALKTSVAPSGQASQTDVLRFPIAGIKSKKVLETIAQNLYQEIGRNELGGSASTKDFASFNTDNNEDPDLLTLSPGDAVQFVVDKRILSSRNPLVSELTTQTRRSFSEETASLAKKLNGDQNLARVLVATARNSIVELQDTFRTKNVRYTLSEGGAVGIDFDFENYIEVRSDAVNPSIKPTTKPPKGKSAS